MKTEAFRYFVKEEVEKALKACIARRRIPNMTFRVHPPHDLDGEIGDDQPYVGVTSILGGMEPASLMESSADFSGRLEDLENELYARVMDELHDHWAPYNLPNGVDLTPEQIQYMRHFTFSTHVEESTWTSPALIQPLLKEAEGHLLNPDLALNMLEAIGETLEGYEKAQYVSLAQLRALWDTFFHHNPAAGLLALEDPDKMTQIAKDYFWVTFKPKGYTHNEATMYLRLVNLREALYS